MAKKTKAKLLSEAEVPKTFEVVKGFNAGPDDERYDVGKRTPHFVNESDFDPGEWKDFVKFGAVRPAVEPLPPVMEDEVVILEEVEK